jgi:hypothetical protein
VFEHGTRGSAHPQCKSPLLNQELTIHLTIHSIKKMSELDSLLMECDQARLKWQTDVYKLQDHQAFINQLFHALQRRMKMVEFKHQGTLTHPEVREILRTFVACAGGRVGIQWVNTSLFTQTNMYGVKVGLIYYM